MCHPVGGVVVSSEVQQAQGACPAGPKTQRLRVPAAVADIQVNHCRMPGCVNFGIPAQTAPVKAGRAKGQSVPRNLPDATVA